MLKMIKFWLRYIKSKYWFQSEPKVYPDGELLLLIRRFMAHKSWFDSISSKWYGRPFLSKVYYVTLAFVTLGLIGVLVNAALLFMLCAGVILFTMNSLLVSHENHRWGSAMIFSEEVSALKLSLQQSKDFFDVAKSNLERAHIELEGQGAKLQEQIALQAVESERVHQQTEALVFIAAALERETTELSRENIVVRDSLMAISQGIQSYNGVFLKSTEVALSFGDDAASFSSTVQDFRANQKQFASAVSDFCIFAQSKAKDAGALVASDHDRQLAEDNALIADWKNLSSMA